MTKPELLDRIDKMIQEEKDHIEWLKTQRLNKFGSIFFPNHNRQIQIYLNRAYIRLEELNVIRIEYEQYDFNT